MVLLQFLPEHDSEQNRNLIMEHALPMVIKYMGSEKSIYGQTNFEKFYQEKFRVIFQIKSFDTVSNSILEWQLITLPQDHEISSEQRIFHVYSTWLRGLAIHQYAIVQRMGLQRQHLDVINNDILDTKKPNDEPPIKKRKINGSGNDLHDRTEPHNFILAQYTP